MSDPLVAACLHASLRSMIVAAIGTAIVKALSASTRTNRHACVPPCLALLVLPFLTPPILAGYAYANLIGVLARDALAREIVYSSLLLARAIPVAFLFSALAPSTIGETALHCHNLQKPSRRRSVATKYSLAMWLQRNTTGAILPFSILFLIAFSDFELVSFFAIPHWTVRIFDAQVGGTPLLVSLRIAGLPLALNLLVLAVALAAVLRLGTRLPGQDQHRSTRAARAPWGYKAYLLFALVTATAVPAACLLHSTRAGLTSMAQTFSLQRELLASILLALAGTAILLPVATRLSSTLRRARRPLVPALLVPVLPGLLGALVVSLLVQGLFQAPGIGRMYDSPLPLLVATTLALMPFAVLAGFLIQQDGPSSSAYSARLLGLASDACRRRASGRLRWVGEQRRYFWLAFACFVLVFFDATTAALLAPSALAPVMPRLYNFMHYGQSAILSATVLTVSMIPALLALLVYPAWRELAVRYG